MIAYRQNTAAQAHRPASPASMPAAVNEGGRASNDTGFKAPVLAEIEQWIERRAMYPSSFGMLAIGDPNLVRDLRAGRDPSSRTVSRIRLFMQGED